MKNLKECFHSGQTVLGTMLSEVYTPNVARVLKAGGFDFLLVDCEHGYFDNSQTANIVAVCNGIKLPVIIRIPIISREIITKVLDMGADGILVPMTGTKEDIMRVVDMAKYAPLGRRGLSTTRAHTEYCPPPLHEYMKIANDRTMVFAQIETREGISNINEILSVEGVDAALIGPNDLASDCGTPGNFTTEEMQSNIAAVIAAGRKAGKPTGIIASNVSFLRDCRDKGMTVFSCDSEVGMIIKGARNVIKTFNE